MSTFRGTVSSRVTNAKRESGNTFFFNAIVDGESYYVRLVPDGTTNPSIPGFGQTCVITGEKHEGDDHKKIIIAKDVQRG